MGSLYVGLVHHPINNKKGEIVTTSVTNLDIHDISRSCKTFGVKNYFLVTPLKAQHELVNRILGHWEEDKANVYNPDRSEALSIAKLVNSIEEASLDIKNIEGVMPKIIVTGANFKTHNAAPSDLRQKILLDSSPYLLLFGTGWGLHSSITDHADYKLAPILGASEDGYNHLSVRSAVAIYLEKLKGN